jgi:capsular exopolysaccharide synthesis family protein
MKWWWLIAIAVAIGGGVGYLIRSNQPDIYFARTTVLFGGGQLNFGTADGNTLQQIRDLITVYAGIVRQDKTLSPVIKAMELNMTTDQINQQLKVNQLPSLLLLEIIYSDTDPIRAADIANAIAGQLVADSPANKSSRETEFKRLQLRELETQIEQLQSQYDALIAKGATLTSAVSIAQNQAELTQTGQTLQSVRELYAQMSAGLPNSAQFIQIYDAATAQNALRVAGSMASVLLAAAGGLAISVATIVLLGFLDDRLQWHEGLEEIMGVKVLGPLGIVPRNKLPLYLTTIPESTESEVLRQLRAKVVLAAGGLNPRILTVTSYDSGDGKTVTSANLALAAAQAGLRTLLIDGDIRKGDLHEIFRLPNVMGFSDILASRDDIGVLLPRALLDTGYENLAILTSGRASSDPAALLSKPRLGEVLAVLSKQFDAVIMDSVPTIGGPDAAFLVERSDGVIIIAHAQRTTRKGLGRTLQSLQSVREGKIYGLAFNRIALQTTSTYNQPYYRRTLAISPEKLNQELINTSKRPSFFGRSRHVVLDKDGTHLYSLTAAAVQLGVSQEILKTWIKTGYVKVTRRRRRQWIAHNDIVQLLDRLPRSEFAAISRPAALPPQSLGNGSGKKESSGKIHELLRDQRDALLAAARESGADESQE